MNDQHNLSGFVDLCEKDFIQNVNSLLNSIQNFSMNSCCDFNLILKRCLEILENMMFTSQPDTCMDLLRLVNEILKRYDGSNAIDVSPVFKMISTMNTGKSQQYPDPDIEFECVRLLQFIFGRCYSDFMSLFEKYGGIEMICIFLKSDNRKAQVSSWKLIKRILNKETQQSIINSKYFLETIVDIISQNSFLQVKIIVADIFLKLLDCENVDQIHFLKKDLCSTQILLNQIHFEHQGIIKNCHHFADKCLLITKYLWCLHQLTVNNKDYQYVRDIGGIPIILSLLRVPNDILFSPNSHNEIQDTEMAEKYSKMIEAASAIVSALCKNECNNLEVAQKSGIYLLARLLLILPNLNNQNLISLQRTLFRALRFLFSLERNRKKFKNIFSPSLYEAFVDIGHFCSNLKSYNAIISIFKTLPESEKIAMRESIEHLNQKEETRCIRDYVIMELLGSGAFGSVYKAKRSKSSQESYCAIKEVNLTECQLGSTSQERSDSIRQIVCELDIIKNQFRHPNVVRYYRTFHDAQNLYVVMAFIEGISLGEQISCMKEKKELYDESRIWKITIQLMLALRYLHKEKSIIHRDLTPNNIMVGDGDHTTITDFGLAKQRLLESRSHESRSILGTLTYVCPEVIQHQPYGEKADIWSLGCIVYQMCTLTQPFNAESELTLAEKICKGRYVPLNEFQSQLIREKLSYCSELVDIVEHCLITNPDIRFGVLDLARLVSDKIFTYLDQSHQRRIELESSFLKERKQRKILEAQIRELNTSREPAFHLDSLIVDNSSPEFSPAARSENDQESDDFNVEDASMVDRPLCLDFQPFQRSISSEFSSVRSSATSDNQSLLASSMNTPMLPPKLRSCSSIDNSNSPIRTDNSRRRFRRCDLRKDVSARLRHGSSSSLMSISQRSLRHIPEDPITKLLTWLHKLYFLCHVPFLGPKLGNNLSEIDLVHSKRCFKSILNHVFQLSPSEMKKEINSLQSGADCSALIDLCPGTVGPRFAAMTGEEFHCHMEDLLMGLDYYQ